MTKNYGWIPDFPDGRDYLYRAIRPRVRLPREVNFRNSWGQKWGRGGYGTIPFDYVESLADDFWTIRR